MKRIVRNALCACALLAVAAGSFAGGQKDAKESGPVTLRFSWWGGDARHNATLAVIDAYQKKNPNVKIEAEYGGFDGYYQKLVTQIAGGTVADIIQIDQPWLFELSSKGEIFMTLDGQKDLDFSGFDANFIKNYCSFDGKAKGLPTGLNGEIMVADTELLKKSGVDPNMKITWDNIVNEGKKVNEANPKTYYLSSDPNRVRFYFEKYLAQKAGGMIKADKSLAFTEAQATEAFTYFKKWFDLKVCAPFAQTSLYFNKSEDNPEWINGNMATAYNWVSTLDKVYGKKENLAIRPMPVWDGAANSGILVRPSQIISVNNGSKHKAEAVKFLNYFFNDPEAILILENTRGVPPTEAGRALLKEKGKMKARVEEATAISLKQMGKPQTVWEMNSEIMQIETDVIDKFGYGLLAPADAAKELIKELNAKLSSL